MDSVSNITWKAEQLRLTLFFSDLLDLGSLFSFEDIFGIESEKNTSHNKNHISEEFAQVEDCGFLIRKSIGRLDVILAPSSQSIVNPPASFPNIGEFSEAMSRFNDYALKVWDAVDESKGISVVRIAFGTTIRHQVDSKENAYAALDKLLPSVNLDIDATDFSYQINRPRTSSIISSVKINRLSAWSANVLKVESMAQVKSIYAASATMDINTDANSDKPLPASSLADMFNELTVLAMEISQNGDIK